MKPQYNTAISDINEILVSYYLSSSWKTIMNNKTAKKILEDRKKLINKEEFINQTNKSKIMANEILKWIKDNKYGKINTIWWASRSNTLSKILKEEISSKNNPTDILIQFTKNKYLGVSVKTTNKNTGNIPFKNIGIGSISKELNINLNSFILDKEQNIVKRLKLPLEMKIRKKYIRNNPHIQKKTINAGSNILNKLRNNLLKILTKIEQKELRNHILSSWLNTKKLNFPYIKITGHGNINGKYNAKVFDPIKNKDINMINRGIIKPIAVGNTSIGILANNKKIMKMRFKYESEKLSSSIKLSGENY